MSNRGLSIPPGSGWGISDYIAREEQPQHHSHCQSSRVRAHQEPSQQCGPSREGFFPGLSRPRAPYRGRHLHNRMDIGEDYPADFYEHVNRTSSRRSPIPSPVNSPFHSARTPSYETRLPFGEARIHTFSDISSNEPHDREDDDYHRRPDTWESRGVGRSLRQPDGPAHSPRRQSHIRHDSCSSIQGSQLNMGISQDRMGDLGDRMTTLRMAGSRGMHDTLGHVTDCPRMSQGPSASHRSRRRNGSSRSDWGLQTFMMRQESSNAPRRSNLITHELAHRLPRSNENRDSRNGRPRSSRQRPVGLFPTSSDEEVYAPRPTRIANNPPVDIRQIPPSLSIIAGGAEISTVHYTIPVRNPPVDATCAICLERHHPFVTPRVCDHTFHVDCLDHWVNSSANNSGACPTCRRAIVPERPLFANHNGTLIPLHRVEQGQPHGGFGPIDRDGSALRGPR